MGLRGRTCIAGPGLFFATTSTVDWKDWFSTSDNLQRLQCILFDTVRIKRAVLMGYVLMPDHVHLLLGTETGGAGLAAFMHSFKVISAKSLNPGGGGIWQDRFDDLLVASEDQFRVKLAYIHRNPVKAGLAEIETDWLFSSARFWADLGTSDVLTKDFAWMDDNVGAVVPGAHTRHRRLAWAPDGTETRRPRGTI